MKEERCVINRRFPMVSLNVGFFLYLERANNVYACAKTAGNNIPVFYIIHTSQYILTSSLYKILNLTSENDGTLLNIKFYCF